MRYATRFTRINPALFLLLGVLALPACLSLNDVPEGLAVLTITNGNNQNVAVNTIASTPLSVQALDNAATPLTGVTVSWSISSGGGTLSGPSSTTDVTGTAAVNYTAGPTAGTAVIKAVADGLTVTFNLTITP